MAIFQKFNANYWQKNIGDCVIRSLSFGTGLGYIEVCNMLGVRWKNGHGLVTKQGVDMERKVEPAFVETGWLEEVYRDDIVDEYFFGDWSEHEDEPLDPEIGDTVSEFMDMYQGQGRFILYVRPPKDEVNRNDWHAVYVNTNNGKVFDTWDSRKYLVFRAYRIMQEKVPNDDPRSRAHEVEVLNTKAAKARAKRQG